MQTRFCLFILCYIKLIHKQNIVGDKITKYTELNQIQLETVDCYGSISEMIGRGIRSSIRKKRTKRLKDVETLNPCLWFCQSTYEKGDPAQLKLLKNVCGCEYKCIMCMNPYWCTNGASLLGKETNVFFFFLLFFCLMLSCWHLRWYRG